MKNKSEIKEELAHAVFHKKELTSARRAIKATPFAIRSAKQHNKMLSLLFDASCQKEVVRAVQLAYAFVRGRPYWQQERHALKPVDAHLVASYAEVSVEVIKGWVAAPVAIESRVAYEEHLLRAQAAERERRAQVRAQVVRRAA